MSQPDPNRVDIHPGTEQRHGSGMANGMGAHAFVPQGGRFDRGLACVALDQDMHAVTGQGLPVSIEEDPLVGGAIQHHFSQCAQPSPSTVGIGGFCGLCRAGWPWASRSPSLPQSSARLHWRAHPCCTKTGARRNREGLERFAGLGWLPGAPSFPLSPDSSPEQERIS